MKKIFLLSVLFLSELIFAQYPVWINSFDTTADMQGWTFYDTNNNGNGWVQGQNIYYNGTALAYGTSGALRYSINNVPTGTAPSFATENDWVVSPQIDLTGASGTITLAAYIGRQRTTHTSVRRYVYIFVSTPQKEVPTLSDFQALTVDGNGNDVASPYEIGGGDTNHPFPTDLNGYVESLVNISAFAGKKIYIGLWSNRKTSGPTANTNVQNININEMAIYSSVLNTKDVKEVKNITKIMENPVTNSLQLQLNPKLKENTTTVSIYNMAGQKVLMTKYSKNMNVSALSAGIYFVEVSDGNLSEKLKFIKK